MKRKGGVLEQWVIVVVVPRCPSFGGKKRKGVGEQGERDSTKEMIAWAPCRV